MEFSLYVRTTVTQKANLKLALKVAVTETGIQCCKGIAKIWIKIVVVSEVPDLN